MAPIDLEVRKREISALVEGVTTLERDLRAQGIDASDEFERMEVMDIINRIERRLAAAPPEPATAYQEAES